MIRKTTIADELFFDSLPLETQQTIRMLARDGYFGTPYHVEKMLDEAYDEGYKNGEREIKEYLESELEQVLCSKCVDILSNTL